MSNLHREEPPMETRFIPVTVAEVVDLLISGREKLAREIVTELTEYERTRRKKIG